MRRFPASTYGRLTLLCVIVEAIVVITLAAVVTALLLRNADLVADTPAKGTPVYLIVFCVGLLYQTVIAADAVRVLPGIIWKSWRIWARNTVQIIAFVAFNFILLCYSVFQYFQITALLDDPLLKADVTDEGALNSIRPALYVIPIIIGVFEVLYVFFAYKLYQEFSWKIYKKIGPEPRMANMYRWYESLMALLKFDIFFGLAFIVIFLILQLKTNDPEFWATIFAIPAALIISLLGVYGVRREDKIITGAFFVAVLGGIAYFVYKIVRLFDANEKVKYEYTWKYLLFYASIALASMIVTAATTVVCYLNFGQGLGKLVSAAEPEPVDVHNPTAKSTLVRVPTTVRTPLEP